MKRHFLSTILLTLLTCAATVGTNVAGAASTGLGNSDWAQIQQAYERYRHAAVAEGAGYEARNHAQQWLIAFDGRGFTARPDAGDWRWGLELVGYGLEGAERAVDGRASVETEQNRVSYAWGATLEEWFVNDTRGLEHGFTLHRRPEGAGERLSFELAVRGGLRPQAEGGRALSFVNDAGAAVVQYAGLKVWDSRGTDLPARLEVADGGRVRISVDDRGAAYPVTVDPVAQQAYLKASNTDVNDGFGKSVAVSGDIAVVGAPFEDSNGTGVNPASQADNSASSSGAAYVFVRSNGVWIQEAYLKASNTDPGDAFGRSVAVSGNIVVVGALHEDGGGRGVNAPSDNGAEDSGAAYVFVRSNGAWIQQAYLKASNADSRDGFGNSVAISGNVIVVGAAGECSAGKSAKSSASDNSTEGGGAAYVFVRSNGAWSQDAYLKAKNADVDDFFGASVAVSGDTVVVGASGEDSDGSGIHQSSVSDNGLEDSGAVYVFERRDRAWRLSAHLKASNSDEDDGFGGRVAISGDTVVVGTPYEDGNGTGVNSIFQHDNGAYDAGAAYVFKRDRKGRWRQEAYLKASNTEAQDGFGESVDVSGDVVVVGARSEDGSGTGVNPDGGDNNGVHRSGAAYVFVRTAGTWSQQVYLKASNRDTNDYFGEAVAVSGDTVIVGAPAEDSSAVGVNAPWTDNSAGSSGAAYVFRSVDACVDVYDGYELWVRIRKDTAELLFDDFNGDGTIDTLDIYALGEQCTNYGCAPCD